MTAQPEVASWIASAGLTVNETACVAGVDPKTIRNELRHVRDELPAPKSTVVPPFAVVYIHVVIGWKAAGFSPKKEFRVRIFQRLQTALASGILSNTFNFADHSYYDLATTTCEIASRWMGFDRWKSRLVIDESIQGGATVFPNSRLPVRTIAGRLESGEDDSVILDDYPYLTLRDLSYAKMYVQAYPERGRPRAFE